jgi:16S rRNA (cytosine967-C5)-methyltransferase
MVLEEGSFLNEVMDGTLLKYEYLEESDRHFLMRLVKGTVEKLPEIDFYLNKISKTPVRKMKKEVRTILRMGVYQIHFMDSVKDHAAVNESVKLAGKHGYPGFKGFINGVLRNYIRQQDSLVPDTEESKYSMPEWIIDLLKEDLGEEEAYSTLEAYNRQNGLTVRFNLKKGSEDEIKYRLEQEGLELDKLEFPWPEEIIGSLKIAEDSMPPVYRISGIDSLSSLKSFQNGDFYIQDLSSMLPVYWAGIRPGMNVLDTCAAPGGKTLIAAGLTGESGRVFSRDKDEKKAGFIRENVEKAGLSNVEVMVQDATIHRDIDSDKYDVAICDVPCSGLGVIGRKSDLRYRVKEEDLDLLQKLQRDIVDATACDIRHGGILVYSTCTINRGENQDNRDYILEKHPEYKLIYDRQILPYEYESDGFYISIFRRA